MGPRLTFVRPVFPSRFSGYRFIMGEAGDSVGDIALVILRTER